MRKFKIFSEKSQTPTVGDLGFLEIGELAHLGVVEGLVEHGLGHLDVLGVVEGDGGGGGQEAGEDLRGNSNFWEGYSNFFGGKFKRRIRFLLIKLALTKNFMVMRFESGPT